MHRILGAPQELPGSSAEQGLDGPHRLQVCLLMWHTQVGPKCHPRLLNAVPGRLVVVGQVSADVCVAYISGQEKMYIYI